MNTQFFLEGVEILSFTIRPYRNKTSGEMTTFSELIIRSKENQVLKFGVSKDLDLTKEVSKKGTLTAELSTFGDSISPSLRAVAFKSRTS